ncbi:MAG: hypothetical protein KIT43_10815 [Bauldia sp.]|nr:hypothetical protein [Bauldia sp.]
MPGRPPKSPSLIVLLMPDRGWIALLSIFTIASNAQPRHAATDRAASTGQRTRTSTSARSRSRFHCPADHHENADEILFGERR